MRGFTGDYYNGLPVFIREDYERENRGRKEEDRLGDMIGASYSSLYGAMTAARQKDERLLYNTGDMDLDLRLQGGWNIENLWHPYKSGFVHEITGEYIIRIAKPYRESFPAWRYVPVGYENDLGRSGSGGRFFAWLAFLAKYWETLTK